MENREDETLAIGKLTLTVKSSTRKETIEVLTDTTILGLKEIIANKFDVEVQLLRLIYAGRILKDTDTIKSLGIKNGSTIYIVIKASAQVSRPNSSSIITNDLQSPLLTNLMRSHSSSDVLGSLFSNNSTLQDVIQRNPELGHIINNPTLLREAMEVVRNPNVANEFVRSADRAMNNIESLPGGFNALQQMYHDIEEPLLNATSNTSNPFASLLTAASFNQQGTENREPFPNPWLPNEFADDELSSDILASPAILSMLEHMQNYVPQSENTSPQVLRDFQSLLSNATAAYSEDGNVDQSNEALSQILSQNLNNQQADPSNLSSEGSMILPALLLAGVLGNQSNNVSNNNLTNSSNVLTNNLTNSNVSQLNIQNRSNIFEQYEERYRLQLEQLSEMGFENREANLRALIASFGNLNQAIEMLLGRNLAS